MRRILTFIFLLLAISANAQPIYSEKPVWKQWKAASNTFEFLSLQEIQYMVPMGRTNAWTLTELPTNSMFGFWNSNGTLYVSRNTNGAIVDYLLDAGGSGGSDAGKMDIDGGNAASTVTWPALLMEFPVGSVLNLSENDDAAGIRVYSDRFEIKNPATPLIHIHPLQVEFTNSPPYSSASPTSQFSLARVAEVTALGASSSNMTAAASNALQSAIDGVGVFVTNREPHINVKDYAVGDGATDDTAAIQVAIEEAMATGLPLWFDPDYTFHTLGTLLVTNPVMLKSSIHDSSRTNIHYSGTNAAILFTNDCDGIYLSGLSIHGSNSTARGLAFFGSPAGAIDHVEVNNCVISDFDTAVWATNTGNTRFVGNAFIRNNKGFDVNGSVAFSWNYERNNMGQGGLGWHLKQGHHRIIGLDANSTNQIIVAEAGVYLHVDSCNFELLSPSAGPAIELVGSSAILATIRNVRTLTYGGMQGYSLITSNVTVRLENCNFGLTSNGIPVAALIATDNITTGNGKSSLKCIWPNSSNETNQIGIFPFNAGADGVRAAIDSDPTLVQYRGRFFFERTFDRDSLFGVIQTNANENIGYADVFQYYKDVNDSIAVQRDGSGRSWFGTNASGIPNAQVHVNAPYPQVSLTTAGYASGRDAATFGIAQGNDFGVTGTLAGDSFLRAKAGGNLVLGVSVDSSTTQSAAIVVEKDGDARVAGNVIIGGASTETNYAAAVWQILALGAASSNMTAAASNAAVAALSSAGTDITNTFRPRRETFIMFASGVSNAAVVGTNNYFIVPYAMQITGLLAAVNRHHPPTVLSRYAILSNGVSIMLTNLHIDATETSSITAVTNYAVVTNHMPRGTFLGLQTLAGDGWGGQVAVEVVEVFP